VGNCGKTADGLAGRHPPIPPLGESGVEGDACSLEAQYNEGFVVVNARVKFLPNTSIT